MMNYRFLIKGQYRYYEGFQQAQCYRQFCIEWNVKVGPLELFCWWHGWQDAPSGRCQKCGEVQ